MSGDVSREVRDLMREFIEVNKEATMSIMRKVKAIIEDSVEEELKNFRQEIASMIQQSPDDVATPQRMGSTKKDDVDGLDIMDGRVASLETRFKFIEQRWREFEVMNRKFGTKLMELAETVFVEEKRR